MHRCRIFGKNEQARESGDIPLPFQRFSKLKNVSVLLRGNGTRLRLNVILMTQLLFG
jgi:hypothetical protein